jgi:hypothetical protein
MCVFAKGAGRRWCRRGVPRVPIGSLMASARWPAPALDCLAGQTTPADRQTAPNRRSARAPQAAHPPARCTDTPAPDTRLQRPSPPPDRRRIRSSARPSRCTDAALPARAAGRGQAPDRRARPHDTRRGQGLDAWAACCDRAQRRSSKPLYESLHRARPTAPVPTGDSA